MSLEWNVPDPTLPIRQGDFLMSRDPQNGRIEAICLVITADCDIAKGKFGKQLACLRLLPFEEYLRTIWAAKKLRKLEVDETEKLRAQLARWHSLSLGQPSTLTAAAALRWVKRDSAEKICADLQVPDPDRKKVCAALAQSVAAFKALDDHQSDDALDRYVEFRARCLDRDPEKCKREVMQQAQKEPLPEDVFLLPSLPQFESTAAVVLLREIVAAPYEAVCYRSADALSSDWFLRTGRLEPTYKYAVSHAFGALYSRIGLPEDYEQRCRAVFDQIDKMSGE